jgi:hypothetical protein
MADKLLNEIKAKIEYFLSTATDEEFWQVLESAGLEVYRDAAMSIISGEIHVAYPSVEPLLVPAVKSNTNLFKRPASIVEASLETYRIAFHPAQSLHQDLALAA